METRPRNGSQRHLFTFYTHKLLPDELGYGPREKRPCSDAAMLLGAQTLSLPEEPGKEEESADAIGGW